MMKEFEGKIKFSCSHTTRKIRDKEVEGVNYYFTDKDMFEKMIADNEFLEWANYNGNYYGTSKKEIESKCGGDSVFILEIDLAGTKNLHELGLDVQFVAILPPSMDVLRQRLIKRGTENEEQIEKRLAIGQKELEEIEKLEFIKYKIVNDDIETSGPEFKKLLLELFPKQLI